jgi:hypothetical protein
MTASTPPPVKLRAVALPELAGPLALGTVASSIALAGGWSFAPAFMLWIIIGARVVPSVLYVRARLRLEKGQPFSPLPALVTSGTAVLSLALLAWVDSLPWLAVVAMLILLARTARGLSRWRQPVRAKIIGFQEVAFGLLTVVLAAMGYRMGI